MGLRNDLYRIYETTPTLDGDFDVIIIEIFRRAHTDADVQAIVEALNRIALRMDQEEGFCGRTQSKAMYRSLRYAP